MTYYIYYTIELFFSKCYGIHCDYVQNCILPHYSIILYFFVLLHMVYCTAPYYTIYSTVYTVLYYTEFHFKYYVYYTILQGSCTWDFDPSEAKLQCPILYRVRYGIILDTIILLHYIYYTMHLYLRVLFFSRF